MMFDQSVHLHSKHGSTFHHISLALVTETTSSVKSNTLGIAQGCALRNGPPPSATNGVMDVSLVLSTNA